MNSVRSNNLSLKYQIPSSRKDTGIIKFEFVAQSQFHYNINYKIN